MSANENNTPILSIDNVLIRETDGYVNATAMCKTADKQLNHYTSNATTKAFLDALSSNTGIPGMLLVQGKPGGSALSRGTWVHPKVAIHLAQWLSAEFAVIVSGVIFDYMSGKTLNAPAAVLTDAQARQIQNAVSARAQAMGSDRRHFQSLYRMLKDHFAIPKYRRIPRDRFDEALNLIRGFDVKQLPAKPVSVNAEAATHTLASACRDLERIRHAWPEMTDMATARIGEIYDVVSHRKPDGEQYDAEFRAWVGMAKAGIPSDQQSIILDVMGGKGECRKQRESAA